MQIKKEFCDASIKWQWKPEGRVFDAAAVDLVKGGWQEWEPEQVERYGDIARHNAVVLQRMLDEAGTAGGGTVLLPEGTYCLKGDTTQFCSYCLTIRHDNIALCGKGRDEKGRYKTVLKTAHEWDGPNGVYRCSGIKIDGTDVGTPAPRKNIMLTGFEMEGGRGWNGVYDWGYDPAIDYGWDIGHKGITVAHDQQVTHVLLRDLYIHRYSGETVFVGGLHVGYLHVEDCVLADTNASCFNLYAKYLLARRCRFGTADTKCRFWIEYCARASTIGYELPEIPQNLEADCAYFVDNCFCNAVGAHGVAIAQGDNTRYAFVFQSNQFDNAACEKQYALFQFAGSVAGPSAILDNEIQHVGGPMLVFDNGGGTQPPNTLLNKNIRFARNRCSDIGSPIIHLLGTWGIWDYGLEKSFPMQQPVENVTIEENYFEGRSMDTLSVAVGSFYHTLESAVCLKDIVIRGNEFCHCTEPQERDEFVGRLPLFEQNVYRDVLPSPGSTAMLTPETPFLQPVFERLTVSPAQPVTAGMRVCKNADGQTVTITAAGTALIYFVPGGKGYRIDQERILKEGQSISFQYQALDEIWICGN